MLRTYIENLRGPSTVFEGEDKAFAGRIRDILEILLDRIEELEGRVMELEHGKVPHA